MRRAMVVETGDERLHICIEDLLWATTTWGQGVIRHQGMLAMTITHDIKVLIFISMYVGWWFGTRAVAPQFDLRTIGHKMAASDGDLRDSCYHFLCISRNLSELDRQFRYDYFYILVKPLGKLLQWLPTTIKNLLQFLRHTSTF